MAANKSQGTAKKPRGKPFQPGNNANPNGRPPKGYSLAEFMRAKLEEDGGERLEQVFMSLYQKAIDPDGPVQAAQELLTRAYGKPVDTVKMDVTQQTTEPAGILTLAAMVGSGTDSSGPA
jgi:hypothetical protein